MSTQWGQGGLAMLNSELNCEEARFLISAMKAACTTQESHTWLQFLEVFYELLKGLVLPIALFSA